LGLNLHDVEKDTGDWAMAQRALQIACLLLLLALSGCTGLFGRQGAPADPLFANSKPAEARAQSGPVAATPFFEPTVPPNMHVVERHLAE
jgi:hypothetical protein